VAEEANGDQARSRGLFTAYRTRQISAQMNSSPIQCKRDIER